MSRSVSWQRTISDTASWRQDQALNETTCIYILREIGPTGFLLKEEGESKKFKVYLGDPHHCTCAVFAKEKGVCKHICWLLLKRFRIPRDNPVTWQLGLVEREINEILQGLHVQQPAKKAIPLHQKLLESASDGRDVHEQRGISENDVCPICQDGLLEKKLPVTYCKFGCGNSVHIKCMTVWAEHQKSQGETAIKCPFCREDFGPFELLKQESRNSSNPGTRNQALRLDRHLGTTCSSCHVRPIEGKCYRCTVCAEYYLCQSCFNTPIHTDHAFQFRQKCNQRWRPAQRQTGWTLPSAVVSDLLNRDISDNDYDLLLQLDSHENPDPSSLSEEAINSLPLEKVRETSHLLAPGRQCRVCLRAFQLQQFVRKLPCQHKFHKDCIDPWLLHSRSSCPACGQVVTTPASLDEDHDGGHQHARSNVSVSGHQNMSSGHGLRRHASIQSSDHSNTDIHLEIPGIGIARIPTSHVSPTQMNSSHTDTNSLSQNRHNLASRRNINEIRSLPNSRERTHPRNRTREVTDGHNSTAMTISGLTVDRTEPDRTVDRGYNDRGVFVHNPLDRTIIQDSGDLHPAHYSHDEAHQALILPSNSSPLHIDTENHTLSHAQRSRYSESLSGPNASEITANSLHNHRGINVSPSLPSIPSRDHHPSSRPHSSQRQLLSLTGTGLNHGSFARRTHDSETTDAAALDAQSPPIGHIIHRLSSASSIGRLPRQDTVRHPLETGRPPRQNIVKHRLEKPAGGQAAFMNRGRTHVRSEHLSVRNRSRTRSASQGTQNAVSDDRQQNFSSLYLGQDPKTKPAIASDEISQPLRSLLHKPAHLRPLNMDNEYSRSVSRMALEGNSIQNALS